MNICYLASIAHNDIEVCLQAKLILRKEEKKNKVMHILGQELPRDLRHTAHSFFVSLEKNVLRGNPFFFPTAGAQ